MKDLLKLSAAFALGLLMAYIFGAFVAGNFDTGTWSIGGRAAAAIVGASIGLSLAVTVALAKDDFE